MLQQAKPREVDARVTIQNTTARAILITRLGARRMPQQCLPQQRHRVWSYFSCYPLGNVETDPIRKRTSSLMRSQPQYSIQWGAYW